MEAFFYDANKDVRYTPEIVVKRFGVPPVCVCEWLALVGDDSGNEELPGVKGIGAKGAAAFLAEHASVAAAIEAIDTAEGRVAKALQVGKADALRELARARLERSRPLPLPLEGLAADRTRDAHAQRALRASWLRRAPGRRRRRGRVDAHRRCANGPAPVPRGPGRSWPPVRAASRSIRCGSRDAAPRPSCDVAGLGVANGSGDSLYVPRGAEAWTEAAAWLEDEGAPKVGHNLVEVDVELRRSGIRLAGIVGDSACASHLTEPSSNRAPHDVEIVAKHVLGRALAQDDAVRGVGKQRKAWRDLPVTRVAAHAGARADASAAIWKSLAPPLAPELLTDYRAISDVCVRMELTGILVDPGELDRAEAAFGEIEADLQAEIDKLAGHTFNVNSSKQLGDVLFAELKLPIAAHTKTGWSTSIEALERIENAHPIVPLVLRWRALRRLRDNWVLSLRRAIDADGRVHSRFNPARSFLGQIVNSNPNLGRVPGRTPEMARIRRAFVAPPGHLLMSVDFNQLGLHVLAHLTKDPRSRSRSLTAPTCTG